jgi:hypothetical protein
MVGNFAHVTDINRNVRIESKHQEAIYRNSQESGVIAFKLVITHPAFYPVDAGALSQGKSNKDVKLTTDL